MITGEVARFDTKRGYGFIHPDDGGEDVFVHQNNIQMDGFRFLNPGERVQFDVEEGERGRKAVQVALLEPRRETPRPPRPERAERSGDRYERFDRPARPERGPRPLRGRYNDDPARLHGEVERLGRKLERLTSILVEKGVLAPGEIDELPGLDPEREPSQFVDETDDELDPAEQDRY